jgi:hypothetical protein
VVDALVNRCDVHVVSSHTKTSLTEVVEESIPAYPVVVECTVVMEEEELLEEPECLRTCKATYKNSE